MPWPPIEPPIGDGLATVVAGKALDPDEELLWAGRCLDGSRMFRRLVWPEFTTPRALAAGSAGGAGILLTWLGCAAGRPWTCVLGEASVLAGALLLRNLTRNARKEPQPFYAVTDRRVLLLDRGGRVIEEHPVDPLDVRLDGDARGVRDLLFAWKPRWGDGGSAGDGFLAVADAAQVEKLVLAAAIRSAEIRPTGSETPADVARRVAKELVDPDPASHARAIGRLGRLDPEALDAVVEQIGIHDPLDGALTAAVGIVGLWRPLGPRALHLIVTSQHSGSPRARSAAAVALRRLGKRAVALLLRAWLAGDSGLRFQARETILRLEDGVISDGLLDALTDNDKAAIEAADVLRTHYRPLELRVAWTWAWGNAAAMERVESVFRGGPFWARMWAAAALCKGATRPGRGTPLARLTAGRPATDPPVAVLLAHQGNPSGVPALVHCIQGEDPDACAIAAGALSRLGAPASPALPALYRAAAEADDPEVRSACHDAAVRIRRAMEGTPTELQAGDAPLGAGTELEAGERPTGRGTEPEAAPRPAAAPVATLPSREPPQRQ